MTEIKVVEEKNTVKINPRDTNVIAVQEVKNYVEVSASGPQGIAGPAGAAGAQGPKGTYTVSETAPASPNVGDTWFNSTTSQMYIRYDGYWVETSTSYAGLNGNDGQGFTYQGTYSSSTTYNYYDVVTYNGSSYICMANNVYANQPDSSQFWAVMAQKGATGAAGTSFTGYDYEIHVSQVDGNDTTGNGDLLTPVASITKALTLVGSQRKTIIVHPGTYSESPSITTQYTTITGPGLLGGNIVISGTVSTSTGCTISGLKMTNFTSTAPSGTGNVNLLNCEVSGTLTKTSNCDYTVIRLCDLTTTNITGGGLVAIFGGNPNFITVNNASANVIVKSAVTVAPVLTAGTLSLVDSVVVAAVTNAVTSAASSVITLANCQLLTSALNNVAPVVLNGFYSILNCVYDKPTSTLVALSGTGGSTNSIDYFQYINADKFITQGGTSSQFVKGDGSLDSTGPVPLIELRETVYALTYASTLTPNATNGSVQTVTLTGNVTINAFTSPVSGQTVTIILTQDGTGSRLLTSTMKFAGGSKTLSTVANSIDILTISYIGTTYYASLVKGYA